MYLLKSKDVQKMIRNLLFAATIAAAAGTHAAEIDNQFIDTVLTYGMGTETAVSMQGELKLLHGIELSMARRA